MDIYGPLPPTTTVLVSGGSGLMNSQIAFKHRRLYAKVFSIFFFKSPVLQKHPQVDIWQLKRRDQIQKKTVNQ
jgi:hypothetical protein